MKKIILGPVLILLLILSQHFASAQNDFDPIYPHDSLVIRYHTEWTENHYEERIKEFKEHPLSMGDIVFIGNSITEDGKNWGAKLDIDNAKNRGISGDVTDGVLLRLGELIKYKPTPFLS